jgi:hypothetical protein
LDRHVEGGDWRDGDALPLPTGKGVRVPIHQCRIKLDQLQEVGHALTKFGPTCDSAVDEQRFADELQQRHPRIE